MMPRRHPPAISPHPTTRRPTTKPGTDKAKTEATHKRDLLDVDTTGEQVGGDEDTRRARAELLHDDLALLLVHVAVHGRDSELLLGELLGEPVDLRNAGKSQRRAERETNARNPGLTFRRVLQKMTAWVMVTVSYKSARVSNFHSSFSTAT